MALYYGVVAGRLGYDKQVAAGMDVTGGPS